MRSKGALAGAAIALILSGTAVAAEAPQVAPGDAVQFTGGPGGCTLGFLIIGSDKTRYITTAGHCVLGQNEARRTWRVGTGPAASTSHGRIGRVVFAENLPTPDGDDFFDFALVRLDDAVRAIAAIDSYGAPNGINNARTDEPSVLRVYGRGSGLSLVAPGRSILAPTLKRPDHVYAHGAVGPGDSGAPVVDENGAAVGTVLGAGGIGYGVGVGTAEVGHDGALNRIGRLSPVLGHAAEALGVRLRLKREP